MTVTIYKNTNFGNNDLVWNVPHPNYDYSVHEKMTFNNVYMRFPLLTNIITVDGDYDFNTAFYDYMIINDDNNVKTYYFIDSIVGERNILLFSVTLDALTTHNILSKPVTGTIVRKHDVNPNEGKFDYPTALNYEGNYQNEIYDFIGYSNDVTRFIESSIDLTSVSPAVSVPSDGEGNIVLPVLPKPSHSTKYELVTWGSMVTSDDSRALTLYLNDNVDEEILNTVRGLSGDGAISDSYTVPTEAISVTASGGEVTTLRGNFLTKSTNLPLSINFSSLGYTPRNEAVKGMFNVSIMSTQTKTRITFPAWDLWESVDSSGNIAVNLWCDPKPSGAPFCCPTQVETLHPVDDNDASTRLATMEAKSVKGGQWLRNPLIYSTARGEIFSTVETQLQRDRANFEKQTALYELDKQKKERNIQIAQAQYNTGTQNISDVASAVGNVGGGVANAVNGNMGGALNNAAGVGGAIGSLINTNTNEKFIRQMISLRIHEQLNDRIFIKMSYNNNLKNLNVSEEIRRIVPREVVFEPNDSLGSYSNYNGFTVSVLIPDIESLKAIDMEYSKYGYPVYETIEGFVMLDNLRKNHTVFQFEKPTVDVGGVYGDMIRGVLEAGIRILSKPYSQANLLNNPK